MPLGAKEATFVFTIEGNTRTVTTAIGIADLDVISPRTNLELATLIRENWSATARPFSTANLPTVYSLANVTVVEQTALGPVSVSAGPPVVGIGGQSVVPINCALLVVKETGVGGRRNKGRMFVPPFLPGESQVDTNGNLVAGVVPTLQALIDSAFDDDTADDIAHVLFHQTGDPTPTGITNLVLDNQIATQRRRMRG